MCLKMKFTTKQYERALSAAIETLSLYADPESYHAIAFLCDPPCGWFSKDVGKVNHPHYKYKPGKQARKTLARISTILK